MKNIEKFKLKQKIPKMLGPRIWSFAQEKMTAITRNIAGMSGEEISTPRFKTSEKNLFRPKRESINQNIERQDFIYARYPILSTHDEKETIEKRAGTDQRAILPLSILKLFSRLLNIRLPEVYIHQNDWSDEFLRKHYADAMTVGNNIHFRTGRFDLRSARGLSLIGHELTHVAQQQTRKDRHTGARPGSEQVESSAIDNERFIMRNADLFNPQREVASASVAMPLVKTAVHALPEAGEAPPVFADESRTTGGSTADTSTAIGPLILSESEMTRIKDEVYRDLMMRIKVESERGA